MTGKAALLYLPIYPDVIRSTAGQIIEYMESIIVLLADHGEIFMQLLFSKERNNAPIKKRPDVKNIFLKERRIALCYHYFTDKNCKRRTVVNSCK